VAYAIKERLGHTHVAKR
jgi:hypothetical protein